MARQRLASVAGSRATSRKRACRIDFVGGFPEASLGDVDLKAAYGRTVLPSERQTEVSHAGASSAPTAWKRWNETAQDVAGAVERRGAVKGNTGSRYVGRTLGQETVPQLAVRTRRDVQRNPGERLTALLHHIHMVSLRSSYVGRKRNATASVDRLQGRGVRAISRPAGPPALPALRGVSASKPAAVVPAGRKSALGTSLRPTTLIAASGHPVVQSTPTVMPYGPGWGRSRWPRFACRLHRPQWTMGIANLRSPAHRGPRLGRPVARFCAHWTKWEWGKKHRPRFVAATIWLVNCLLRSGRGLRSR